MMIDRVNTSDKEEVLKFCQNTFSWGDYISEVWDFWLEEGGFFVIRKNNLPIAICHASISRGKNVWIEGIRVNPNFRRQECASKLVNHSEKFGSQNNCNTAQMLIETNNHNSLKLAKKLSYTLKETWNFFSLTPKKTSSTISMQTSVNDSILSIFEKLNFSYVDSWRWYDLDELNIKKLNNENRIIFSEENNKLSCLAVYTDSIHFEKTLIVTILMGDKKGITDILSYISELSQKRNFKRIQILTNLKKIPSFEGLEKKLSFHLVSKNI